MGLNKNRWLLPEGELAHLASQHKYDWADLTFFAAGDNQKFSNVEVVTLKQRAIDTVADKVIEQAIEDNFLNNDIVGTIKKRLDEYPNPVVVSEFVDVLVIEDETMVVVGVNFDKITDEAIDHALTLLERVDNYSETAYYSFGTPFEFTVAEL